MDGFGRIACIVEAQTNVERRLNNHRPDWYCSRHLNVSPPLRPHGNSHGSQLNIKELQVQGHLESVVLYNVVHSATPQNNQPFTPPSEPQASRIYSRFRVLH